MFINSTMNHTSFSATPAANVSETWCIINRYLACKNIINFKMECAFNTFLTCQEENIFHIENSGVRLLKRINSIYFCKVNSKKENEYIIYETNIKNIRTITLLKGESTQKKTEIYNLYISENNSLCWNIELCITSK